MQQCACLCVSILAWSGCLGTQHQSCVAFWAKTNKRQFSMKTSKSTLCVSLARYVIGWFQDWLQFFVLNLQHACSQNAVFSILSHWRQQWTSDLTHFASVVVHPVWQTIVGHWQSIVCPLNDSHVTQLASFLHENELRIFWSFIRVFFLRLLQSHVCRNLGLVIADNGTISPVIQSTNRSRVPSSRPRTDVCPEGKDTRSNVEHKVERKRWVPTPCYLTMLYNPTGMW